MDMKITRADVSLILNLCKRDNDINACFARVFKDDDGNWLVDVETDPDVLKSCIDGLSTVKKDLSGEDRSLLNRLTKKLIDLRALHLARSGKGTARDILSMAKKGSVYSDNQEESIRGDNRMHIAASLIDGRLSGKLDDKKFASMLNKIYEESDVDIDINVDDEDDKEDNAVSPTSITQVFPKDLFKGWKEESYDDSLIKFVYPDNDKIYIEVKASGAESDEKIEEATSVDYTFSSDVEILDKDGNVISRSRNFRGVWEYASKHVADLIKISEIGRRRGLLEIDFENGVTVKTEFADFSVLRNFIAEWRNVYGTKLMVNGEDAGTVSYKNEYLREAVVDIEEPTDTESESDVEEDSGYTVTVQWSKDIEVDTSELEVEEGEDESFKFTATYSSIDDLNASASVITGILAAIPTPASEDESGESEESDGEATNEAIGGSGPERKIKRVYYDHIDMGRYPGDLKDSEIIDKIKDRIIDEFEDKEFDEDKIEIETIWEAKKDKKNLIGRKFKLTNDAIEGYGSKYVDKVFTIKDVAYSYNKHPEYGGPPEEECVISSDLPFDVYEYEIILEAKKLGKYRSVGGEVIKRDEYRVNLTIDELSFLTEYVDKDWVDVDADISSIVDKFEDEKKPVTLTDEEISAIDNICSAVVSWYDLEGYIDVTERAIATAKELAKKIEKFSANPLTDYDENELAKHRIGSVNTDDEEDELLKKIESFLGKKPIDEADSKKIIAYYNKDDQDRPVCYYSRNQVMTISPDNAMYFDGEPDAEWLLRAKTVLGKIENGKQNYVVKVIPAHNVIAERGRKNKISEVTDYDVDVVDYVGKIIINTPELYGAANDIDSGRGMDRFLKKNEDYFPDVDIDTVNGIDILRWLQS